MAKLDDTEIHRIVQNEIDDAVLYQEEEHTGFRDTATNYYYGEPFGNEVENQSPVVSRDVADTVGFIMPSLMKIFASSKDYVSFQPRHPEDEDAAKQASEYVNWIVTDQNPGYKVIQNWMHDALLFRLGVRLLMVDLEKGVCEFEESDYEEENAEQTSGDDDYY